MQFDYDIYGSMPVLKKYQVGTGATSSVGVPYLIAASNTAGLVIATTTGATDMVGCNLDAATYTTTQGQGKAPPQGTTLASAASAERMNTMIINPFAVWSIKMSGSATENTALTAKTVTTASSGGTAVTTGDSWTSTQEFDEGVTWGYTGTNVGQTRKITSTSSTAGTVLIPFDNATVVGDTFLRAPFWPTQCATVQLTTLLTQADCSISVGTGAPFRVIELRLKASDDNGASNSFVLACSNSHFINLA